MQDKSWDKVVNRTKIRDYLDFRSIGHRQWNDSDDSVEE